MLLAGSAGLVGYRRMLSKCPRNVTRDGAGDRVAGLSTRLLVLFLAMVVVGFVIPSPSIAGDPATGTGDSQYEPLARPSNPELLLVPDIGLKAPIVPIDIQSDGVLDPPDDVHEVGWWTGAPSPAPPPGRRWSPVTPCTPAVA